MEGQKKLRVLLFSPSSPHLGGEESFGLAGCSPWFPLGPFALANAAYLEHLPVEARIYYNLDYTPATLETLIRDYEPDMVGINCFTRTRFACFELAQIVKKVNSKIKVLLGGVHATFLDQQVMEHYPSIDMILRGYAEETFVETLKAILDKGDFKHIRGLTWKDANDGIHRNTDRAPGGDLNQEIAPESHDLFIGGLPKLTANDMLIAFSLPVETSRGCAYTCFFCSRMDPTDRTLVKRDPALAVRHVRDMFKIVGHREVYFCDTNFTINKKRVFEFCEAIRTQDFEFEWSCGTRVDLVDREMLMAMKEAGCRKIYYGVDSLCKRILPMIGRNFLPETAVKNLNLTVECGFNVEANIIIGFPTETADSVMEAYSYRKQVDEQVHMVVQPLMIMPGGALYYHALREGFQEDYWLEDHGPEFPIYTGSMSEERIREYCQIMKNPKEYADSRKSNFRKSLLTPSCLCENQ